MRLIAYSSQSPSPPSFVLLDNMWRTRLTAVWDRALGRRPVGRDSFGNFFYLQTAEPGKRDRRIVENKTTGTPDAAEMDTEWWAWLHNRREAPYVRSSMPLPFCQPCN